MRPSFLAWAFLLPFISSASAALLTVTANPVVGLERPLSNGERFQRGLLPAAPKRRAFRARGSYGLPACLCTGDLSYSCSFLSHRILPLCCSEAMPSPDPATRGRIRIINSDGSFLGYRMFMFDALSKTTVNGLMFCPYSAESGTYHGLYDWLRRCQGNCGDQFCLRHPNLYCRNDEGRYQYPSGLRAYSMQCYNVPSGLCFSPHSPADDN